MKATVITPEPVAVPAPIIMLELTLAELIALLATHNAHGGGSPDGLRGDIESALESACESLPEPWRRTALDVVTAAPTTNNTGNYIYDYVTKRRAELGS